MSKFAEQAASAREAHEDAFGGTVVCIPTTGDSFSVPAIVYQEKTRSRPNGLGMDQVITRRMVIRKSVLTTLKKSYNFSVDNQIYSINEIHERGADRYLIVLERLHPEEISRPEYRGMRQ